MIYLDNDTIKTLAELDLIDLLCEALEVAHDPGEVFCLRTAKPSLGSKIWDPETRGRTMAFLERVGPPSTERAEPHLAEIEHLPNMDVEAILFACCVGDPGTRTVTGDLKSVRSLADHAPEAIFDALQGRVVSTEQCLLRILDLLDFEEVQEGWRESPCDHRFFSTLIGMDEAGVRAAIRRRLDALSPRMRILIGWP